METKQREKESKEREHLDLNIFFRKIIELPAMKGLRQKGDRMRGVNAI